MGSFSSDTRQAPQNCCDRSGRAPTDEWRTCERYDNLKGILDLMGLDKLDFGFAADLKLQLIIIAI